MVSNFERLLAEIRREASRLAPSYKLDPEDVVKLVMEIVDLEDQHRIKAHPRIRQEIRSLIESAVKRPHPPESS